MTTAIRAQSPSDSSGAGSRAAIRIIMDLTWIDFQRRKDVYVVGIMMGLFLLAAVAVRTIGIKNTDTAQFLMSAGLTLSHFLAALLAISFCSRAFPEEFENGTLMTLMAKPVSRDQALLGKYLGVMTPVWSAYAIFVLATLVVVPLVEGQRWGALVQVAILRLTSLAMLGAAVIAVSFYLPPLVCALIGLVWYFGAGMLLNLCSASAGAHWPQAGRVIAALVALAPDPTLLDHTDCFAGSSDILEARLAMGLLIYGVLWTVAFYLWARVRFNRIRL